MKRKNMKRKRIIKLSFIIIVINIFFFMVVRGNANARHIELLEGKLSLTGFLKNQTTIRTTDHTLDYADAGQLQMFRNTLQMEQDYKFCEGFHLYAIERMWYEGMWDLDHSLDQRAQNEMKSSFSKGLYNKGFTKSSFDEFMRELYFIIDYKDLQLRIGKQQVVWGESDGLRMSDIINPLDMSWHYIFENWEDIRIPLWMMNLKYNFPFGMGQNLRGELVWIPGDFRHSIFAKEGAPWVIPGFVVPGLPENLFITSLDSSKPSRQLRNSEIGFRLQGFFFNNLDLALFVFYSRQDGPVFKEDWLIRAINSGFRPTDIYDFLWTTKIGGSLNFYEPRTKVVYRAEWAFTNKEPYNDIFLSKLYKRNTFAYMIGFDRPTFIKPLNENKTFFLSGQLFQKYILGWHDSDNINTPDQTRDRYSLLVSFFISTEYYQDTIAPQIFLFYDFSNNGWVNPQIKYNPTPSWIFTMGAHFIFSHNNIDGYLGPVRKDDEVYFEVKYQF